MIILQPGIYCSCSRLLLWNAYTVYTELGKLELGFGLLEIDMND